MNRVFNNKWTWYLIINEPGNVVILLKYYETSSKIRFFYDSSNKNDYLEYVSQGINQNKVINYSRDEEKSVVYSINLDYF